MSTVVAPVRQVYLTVEDTPATDDERPIETGRSASTPARVRFVDGEVRYVRCVAVGGYPAPSLHLYVNERDLTASTRLRSELLMRGRPGLRMLVTRTERRAGGGGLVLSPDDDGSRLRCVATVPGLATNITETIIDVHCKAAVKSTIRLRFDYRSTPVRLQFERATTTPDDLTTGLLRCGLNKQLGQRD